MTTMSIEDNISLSESLLECDGSQSPDSSQQQPDSLPTFQIFREKKSKVEEEMKYHYR